MPKYLYHYAPPNNTIERDGLLSTALQHGVDPYDKEGSGWRKYKSIAKESGYPATRDGVLRWLDASLPGFKRSNGISVLTEQIPDNANSALVDMRNHSVLVRIQPAAKLLAAGVVTGIWKNGPKGHETGRLVKDTSDRPVDWGSGDDKYRFRHPRHYILQTADGHIPPEYIEVINNV